MSTAAVADAPGLPAKKGKKKLIMIVAISVLLLGGGGAAAMLLLKKKPHAGDAEAEQTEGGGGKTASSGVIKPEARPAPVFVPLEPFTVNLADRDAERYAQVGITLEIDDAKTGEQIKIYMPSIRNHFLMTLADSSASDLLGRDGKLRLAEKLRRDAARALGYTVPELALEKDGDEAAVAEGDTAPKKKAKKPRKPASDEIELPIRAVHFSNFIIQ